MLNHPPIDKQSILSKHFLFRQLLPIEIDRLAKLSVERRYDNGQTIFVKGEKGDCMMIVLEGKVLISAMSDEGKEITLNYIEPGGVLGEIALLDGKPRSANASAVGNCMVSCIQHSDFIPFLKSNSDMAIQLLMVLCEKLRSTSDMLENLGLLPVPARLANLILRMADKNGAEKITTGCVVQLTLSQQKMANLIGTSRETVNRVLSQWQSDGLITLNQQQLIIAKPTELALVAETSL